jgi:glycerol-3-phosphate cytidylyltransferase-like family protein
MKKRQPLHNQELRCELVNSLSIVDAAIVGNEDDIFETVKLVKPNVIALGYDQIHQEKFISDGCKRINLDVKIVRLQSPAPKLSSSDIKKEYGKDIHDL